MTDQRPSLWQRLLALIDDALPVPPDQQASRDEDGGDPAEHHRRRLRLHLFEKRGKGGFR